MFVLGYDGSKKTIEKVKVGDKVIASDPETGEQAAETVEAVWKHRDTLTDLVVGGRVLTTTEDHLFWAIADRKFERVDEFARGEKVLTADGRTLTVSGLRASTARDGTAYNLTAADIHTYHVGHDQALVHNTCGGNAGTALPSGEKAAVVGARIWGHGKPSHSKLYDLPPAKLREIASQDDAVTLRNWYAAAEGKKGGQTAGPRVVVVEKIIDPWYEG
ncbi:MAG: polymorphic toxin-type HINT domain-containing protein [Aeromicrobium erythreum]